MTQPTARWLKLGLALIIPLLLYAVLAERASWRPRAFHYGDVVTAVSYSPDGRWLACLSLDRLDVRDAQTKQVMWSEGLGDNEGKAVAFSTDGRTLALSRNNGLQLWDALAHAPRHDLLAYYPYWHDATALLFIPANARLITGGTNSQVLLWDARSGKLISAIGNQKNAAPLALAPDAQTLALSVQEAYAAPYIRLWNLAGGRKQRDLYAPFGDNFYCAVFAPDNKTLVVGTGTGQIVYWDIATGHKARHFVAHPHFVAHLALSSDGQFMASSSMDEVKLWNARQGTFLRTLTERGDNINGLTFASDGATLAIACGQTVQLWRVK